MHVGASVRQMYNTLMCFVFSFVLPRHFVLRIVALNIPFFPCFPQGFFFGPVLCRMFSLLPKREVFKVRPVLFPLSDYITQGFGFDL